MDRKKIEGVKDWPKPTNVKEVQSFLGFANYYRDVIEIPSESPMPSRPLAEAVVSC